MRVDVLYNADHDAPGPGRAAREDVSRVARAVGAALREAGREVTLRAVAGDPLATLCALREARPDLAFNLCESVGGDARGEAAMGGALELLGIPFTGSGALALGLALHKDKAKALLRQRGIPTPDWQVLEPGHAPDGAALPSALIVKPVREDGSLGIAFDSVVRDPAGLLAAARRVWALGQPALVEGYVEGRELMVAFLGNAPRRVVSIREIAFGAAFDGRPRIVTYDAKWAPGSPQCRDSASVGCALPPALRARVERVALETCDALGCRDYGRVDLRLSADGEPWVIDVNPNCDLNPDAGFAQGAAEAGLDYRSLVAEIVEVALARTAR